MVPARRVERQRAGDAGIPGEDRPDAVRGLQRLDDPGHRLRVAVPHVDRPAAGHDARRAAGQLAGEGGEQRVEVDGAGVRREPVVGSHPEVERAETARGAQAFLGPAGLPVHGAERGHRGRVADAVGVRRRVGIAQPEDGHRRIDLFAADLKERVDGVPVAAAVGRRGGRRRPDPFPHPPARAFPATRTRSG